jgi:tRNA(His) 5'-end guanylyltransferase
MFPASNYLFIQMTRDSSSTSPSTANPQPGDTTNTASTSSTLAIVQSSVLLQKFKFLTNKISHQQETALSTSTVHSGAAESPQSQISQYLSEVQDPSFITPQNAFDFWKQRRQIYKQLAPLAEDLLAAPASQAYVERIFSLCGILTTGRRNRMSKSLEMRVCLKLNKKLLIR